MSPTLKTPGDNSIVRELTSERAGVLLVGFINKCEPHSRNVGSDQWHSAVEFFHFEDGKEPVFLHRRVLKTGEEYHNAEPEARALVETAIVDLFQEAENPEIEPADYIKSLVDQETAEDEETRGGMSGMLRMLAAMLAAMMAMEELLGMMTSERPSPFPMLGSRATEAQEGDDKLPGLFGGFDPSAFTGRLNDGYEADQPGTTDSANSDSQS